MCVCVCAVSLELCDVNRRGKIEQNNMEEALNSINETAGYFGDQMLKRTQIKVRVFLVESHPIQVDVSMQKHAPTVVVVVGVSKAMIAMLRVCIYTWYWYAF